MTFFERIIQRVSVRSLVVLILVIGSLGLALTDASYRPKWADLVTLGVGGYLGQLVPKKEN